MNRAVLRAGFALGAGLIGVFAGAANAGGVTTQVFRLHDHPDGNINPPPYGLRYDDLFKSVGGPGGSTSFSFEENGASMRLIVSTDTMTNAKTIRIVGKVYGGKDNGASVSFGAGLYKLDFTYTQNVAAHGTGWKVTGTDSANNGSLVSLGNADVAAGTTWSFSDKGDGKGNSFYFKQDDHRLAGHPEFGQGYWVGHGWVMSSDGRGLSSTRDFLFLGKPIPLPTAGLMGAIGLLGLAGVRRRG